MSLDKKAWVVGGEHSLVKGNFGRKLGEVGIEVASHLHSKNTLPEHIPTGCEAVIIIVDMVSHSLFWRAVELAKKENVPYALVPRKFAKALPVLKAKGIATVPDEIRCVSVSPQDLEDFVASYILEAVMEERVPGYDEVNSAAHRAFNGALEEERIDQDMFVRVRNQEVAKMSRKTKKADRKETTTTTIREWAELAIEEDPGIVKDSQRLATVVKRLGDAELTGVADRVVYSGCESVLQETLDRWNQLSKRGSQHLHTKQERQDFIKLKLKWYRQWAADIYKATGKLPSWKVSRQTAQGIFGSFTDDAWEIRREITGEPPKKAAPKKATKTVPVQVPDKSFDGYELIPEAFKYYQAICQVFRKDAPIQTAHGFRQRLSTGAFVGKKLNPDHPTSPWYIQIASIEDWLATEHGMDIRPITRPDVISATMTPPTPPEPEDTAQKEIRDSLSGIKVLLEQQTHLSGNTYDAQQTILDVLVRIEEKLKEPASAATPTIPTDNESIVQFLSQWGEVRLIKDPACNKKF